MTNRLFSELWRACKAHFALPNSLVHGPDHWRRVQRLGLWLAGDNASDALMVRAFAPLHDCCRCTEGFDFEHGKRAADFAAFWFQSTEPGRALALLLGPEQVDLLIDAIYHHNNDQVASGVKGLLWDADRLDLVRLERVPDARYLSTHQAKTSDAVAYAKVGLREIQPSKTVRAAQAALMNASTATMEVEGPSGVVDVPSPNTLLYHLTFSERWPLILRNGLCPSEARKPQQRYSGANPRCIYLGRSSWAFGFTRSAADTLIVRVRLKALEESGRAPDDDYLRGLAFAKHAWSNYPEETRREILQRTNPRMWELMEERRAEWPHSWAQRGTLAYFGCIPSSQFHDAAIVRAHGADALIGIGKDEGLVADILRESDTRPKGSQHPHLLAARKRFQDRAMALAFDYSRKIPGIERYDHFSILAAKFVANTH